MFRHQRFRKLQGVLDGFTGKCGALAGRRHQVDLPVGKCQRHRGRRQAAGEARQRGVEGTVGHVKG